AQQSNLGICIPAPQRHRGADPLHPPSQHARAVDPRGGDHPARNRGAQCRRGLIGAAPCHRGGTQLQRSIIKFYYKNDKLNDPMVSEEHITAFGWASPQEIDDIMALAIRVNDFLSGLFLGVGIRLVDFKMETGRLWENDVMRIVVADEISPDSCRLWDIKTN